MKSIRRQLLVFLLCSLAALFIVVGSVLYVTINNTVYREFNRDLKRETELLAAQVNTDEHGKLQLDLTLVPGRLSGRTLMVLNAAGEAIYRSPDIVDLVRQRDALGFSDVINHGEEYRNFAVTGTAHPDEDVTTDHRGPAQTFTLIYGQSIVSTQRIARIVAYGFLIAGLIVIGISAALIVWIVTRGLAPLRQLTNQVHQMDASSLKQPLILPDSPIELKPMVERLNELMRRLNDAFERQARFTANAAHEFRTPIAEIRSAAEVALMRPWLGEAEILSFNDVLSSANRMQAVIATLLNLARAHESSTGLQTIDLPGALDKFLVRLKPTPSPNDIEVQNNCHHQRLISATPESIDGILTNLIHNALEYRHGTDPVSIKVTDTPTHLRLDICNVADAADAASASRFGEQFWRNSVSRSDATHSGLGCALVKMYSKMIGATVIWTSPTDQPSRINAEVLFPIAVAADE